MFPDVVAYIALVLVPYMNNESDTVIPWAVDRIGCHSGMTEMISGPKAI